MPPQKSILRLRSPEIPSVIFRPFAASQARPVRDQGSEAVRQTPYKCEPRSAGEGTAASRSSRRSDGRRGCLRDAAQNLPSGTSIRVGAF